MGYGRGARDAGLSGEKEDTRPIESRYFDQSRQDVIDF
jgi:hypothetical protein